MVGMIFQCEPNRRGLGAMTSMLGQVVCISDATMLILERKASKRNLEKAERFKEHHFSMLCSSRIYRLARLS